MTEKQRKKANLVKLLIEQGWNPPRPSSTIVARIADDIERVSNIVDSREKQYQPTLDLSPGELRVLTFASQGYSMPETAALLDRSVETIKSHMSKAMGRLGARTQAQAVAMCIRAGLIDPHTAEEEKAA